MKLFKDKDVVLWDFEGVILDSMKVREDGFREVLANYPTEQVDRLLSYHNKNGGLSRYVKFRYFQKEVLSKDVDEKEVMLMAREFSEIMKRKLTSKERLIKEVFDFIIAEHKRFEMHIVSGSDGEELRFLAGKLEISTYFKTIQGSPTPKISLVGDIMKEYGYNSSQVCLIGDSINDYEAAKENDIEFYGYNNSFLKTEGYNYIDSFS